MSISKYTPQTNNCLEYQCWAGMIQRCTNPNNPKYKNYGGIGITVCERWRNSFKFFLEDMGSKPTPKHTIDRIDNSLGYFPGNCRWITRFEQSINRSTNVLSIDQVREIRKLSSEGITQKALSIKYSVDKTLIYKIVHNKIWKNIT